MKRRRRSLADLEEDVTALEEELPAHDAETSVELTPEVKGAIRAIYRHRRERSVETGEHIELMPAVIREALDHMDNDLAAAFRGAYLDQ